MSILKPPLWAPGIVPSHPINRGLVGAWPMWEGSGNVVHDVSGNGNHGTLTGMAADDWVQSPYGHALDLDGSNDHILMPLVVASPPFSVVSLFRASASVQYLFSISDTGSLNNSHVLESRQASGYARVYSNSSGGYGQARAFGTYSVGEWYIAVGVWAADDSRTCYLAGIASGSDATLISPTGLDETRIGSNGSSSPSYGPMQAALTLLYNRALTAAEIAQLYADPWAGFRQQDETALWSAATQGGGTPPGLAMPVAMHHYRQMRCA